MLQLTGMEGEAGARHSETQRCHGGGDGGGDRDGDGDGEGDDDVMVVHNKIYSPRPLILRPPMGKEEGIIIGFGFVPASARLPHTLCI